MKLIKFFYLLFSVSIINFSLAQNCDLPPTYNGNTGSNMSVFFTSTFLSSLNATDENAYLVALTSSGLVVGSRSIYGLSQTSIALWSDDSQTPEIDGALANEVISFQLVNGTDLYDVFMPSPVVYVINDLIFLINPAVTTLVECSESVYGCTDAAAFNFDTIANTEFDPSTCIAVIEGCTDAAAFNFDTTANTDDNSCIAVIEGCTDAAAFNFDTTANTDDNSCIAVVEGCTDATAFNYDSTANTDDNSCIAVKEGCTDATAFNFDTTANTEFDPSTCIAVKEGCTDATAFNYESSANTDNGSCIAVKEGCTDAAAFNFDTTANTDDNSCIEVDEGCTDATAFNYSSTANTDNGSCVAVEEGCTDASAFNYNSAANTDDNSCIEVVEGCTDATAFNYNSTANTDNGSCIEVIEGCTDTTACNYNAAATNSDACVYTTDLNDCATCSGEQDGTGTVVDNDTDSDGVCDSDEIPGCTDTAACNYNAAATDSDDDLCYTLTVAVDTSSLTSVLTAIVSPADSVVEYSWLYNGAEVGIESTYTALENGVYSVEVSNSTCDASASFKIQYVSLHELNSLEVNLYPNPFKDIINIDFMKATSNIELRILNTLGEEVKYEKIVQNRDSSEIQIQVSDLPKGMYILRVNSGNYLNSFVLIKN